MTCSLYRNSFIILTVYHKGSISNLDFRGYFILSRKLKVLYEVKVQVVEEYLTGVKSITQIAYF